MKLHVDTHRWLVNCKLFVDDLDVSRQCRGVDLETRSLYMAGGTATGPWPPLDLEVTLGVTERLRLMLDGREIMAQGLDLPAAVHRVRELTAEARADLGKLPTVDIVVHLLTGLEEALA